MTIATLAREVRYAVRRLVRDWRFSVAAILLLGLGIGANTATFSLVNATLLRRPSTADLDRLVDIYERGSNPNGIDANAYPAYLDLSAFTDVFAATTASFVPRPVHFLDNGSLRPAIVEHTTASYLQVFGLQPSLGRWFTASEDAPGAPVVAVVSHETWQRKFAASPSVVGRTILIDGVPAVIVGVGPDGHTGTLNTGMVTDFWLPVSSLEALGVPSEVLDRDPEEAAFFVKARLRPGVTVAQAQAAMDVLGRRLAQEYPREDPGQGFAVFASRDVRVHPEMDGLLTAAATVLLVLVGLVLAIAASNLATFLLVRGTARAKEVSLRLALGASRGQIVRYLLVENLVLAIAGGALGCLLAWWGVRLLGTIELPVVVDVALDPMVLAYAAVVSIVTGLAFGLMPALRTTRVDLASTLRGSEAARSRTRWLTLRNGLVVFQVAMSIVLIGIATLFLQVLHEAQDVRTGFSADGVAMLETDARYAGGGTPALSDVAERFRQRVATLPGVSRAVLTHGLPMQPDGVRIEVEGDVPQQQGPGAIAPKVAGAMWAGPGLLEVLQVPLLAGRTLDARDGPGTPRVAVISASMAERYFHTTSPAAAIGRRFRLQTETEAVSWIAVVGVAADTATADLQSDIVSPTRELFYRPYAQWGVAPTTVVAKTASDTAALVRAMQRELRAIDPALPVVSATTMTEYLDESLAVTRAAAAALGGLGLLGLGLAGIGLYAVIAFAVSRRVREIGIRIALGARSRQVVATVVGEIVMVVGAGTGVGLGVVAALIAIGQRLSISTPGIALYRPSFDPLTLAGIVVFMALVGAIAAFVPVRRAVQVDPVDALRSQ